MSAPMRNRNFEMSSLRYCQKRYHHCAPQALWISSSGNTTANMSPLPHLILHCFHLSKRHITNVTHRQMQQKCASEHSTVNTDDTGLGARYLTYKHGDIWWVPLAVSHSSHTHSFSCCGAKASPLLHFCRSNSTFTAAASCSRYWAQVLRMTCDANSTAPAATSLCALHASLLPRTNHILW
jgi:hypothetical protein